MIVAMIAHNWHVPRPSFFRVRAQAVTVIVTLMVFALAGCSPGSDGVEALRRRRPVLQRGSHASDIAGSAQWRVRNGVDCPAGAQGKVPTSSRSILAIIQTH